VPLALYLLLLRLFWVGFLGSDDSLYWHAAGGWLRHFPFVGDSHWALRHPLVLPIALCRWVLGDTQFALVLPTVLYASGIIIVMVGWIERRAGYAAALIAGVLIAFDVQFVLLSSTADIDFSEAFFVLLGFCLFDSAIADLGRGAAARAGRMLVASGAALGLAMLCRETAAFALVALGLLFLAGFGMERWRYFVQAAGFVIVVGADMLFLWAGTGDPLHRWRIAATHDLLIDRWAEQGAAVPLIHPAIDPVTMLLINHNFGLLTWIGVPLVLWLWLRKPAGPATARLTAMLGLLALVWTVISAALWTELVLSPRYYLLPTIIVSALSGIALACIGGFGRRARALGLGALIVLGSLAALMLDNKNLRFGEHALTALAASSDQVIHTDPATLARASVALEWEGAQNKVSDAPPAPGDLYLFNPGSTGHPIRPGADWQIVKLIQAPEPLLETVLQPLLAGYAPESVWLRLRGHPGVTLYRVGQ